MILRRSPSSSSSPAGSSAAGTPRSRSIPEPAPHRVWTRRTTRAAAAAAAASTKAAVAAATPPNEGDQFPLLSPQSAASSENDADNNNKSTKWTAPSRRILRRRSMSAMSTSPSGTATTVAATSTRRTTRRHSLLMSSNNKKSPTSPSTKTPPLKRHGMTLRSTARKRQEEVASSSPGTIKFSSPFSLEKKLRKSVSFLTPPSQPKKSRSSASGRQKKIYKKTPVPSRKKKTMDIKGDESPMSVDKTLAEGLSVIATGVNPTTIQEEKEAALLDHVIESSNETVDATITITETDEGSFHDAVQDDDDDVKEEESEAETITADDSLTQVAAAVEDLIDAVATSGVSMGTPAIDEKDAAWAKLPVDGEEEEEEEELSLMEEAIALFLNDNKPTLPPNKKVDDHDTISDDDDAVLFHDKKPTIVPSTIITSTKIDNPGQEEEEEKEAATADHAPHGGQESTEKEMVDDSIPLLVASTTDLEPMVSSDMVHVKEEQSENNEKMNTSTEFMELMDWKHVGSLLLGALVLTASLAMATQHLNGFHLLEADLAA